MTPGKLLPPVRPNPGLQARYRRIIEQEVRRMHFSYMYWIAAKYRNNEPEVSVLMAQDALPSAVLRRALKALAKRWQKRFDDLAPKLAAWFATAAADRSDVALKKMLRYHGWTVSLQMTKPMKDALNATIGEQVGLIKSIPMNYHTAIEGKVMRSVAAGGDLSTLTKDLQKSYGVTFRRAALIAKDQNNKATATLTRTRQLQIGIKEAVWMHSHGGREPRPTHLANSGKRYDVSKGWYDPDANGKGKGAWVFPGTLINCRCVSGSVIPALG